MESATLDGRRVRGATSRSTVMRAAVDLASVDGLEGLSIGGLATVTAMSKGGVVALFGSKEQLQLATIEAAKQIFVASVIAPALTEKGGRGRLEALMDAWLHYSESRVFSGGCFFASATAELGARPGPVRDAVAQAMTEWHDVVRRVVQRAIDLGELDPTDVEQLVFDLTSTLDGANALSLLFDSTEPYARARTSVARLLR